MGKPTNLKWKCIACGKELDAHDEEGESCQKATPPECPKCGIPMVRKPKVYQDPPP